MQCTRTHTKKNTPPQRCNRADYLQQRQVLQRSEREAREASAAAQASAAGALEELAQLRAATDAEVAAASASCEAQGRTLSTLLSARMEQFEDAVAAVTSEKGASIAALQGSVAQLRAALQRAKERYSALERRRTYDLEGFTRDVSELRRTVRALELESAHWFGAAALEEVAAAGARGGEDAELLRAARARAVADHREAVGGALPSPFRPRVLATSPGGGGGHHHHHQQQHQQHHHQHQHQQHQHQHHHHQHRGEEEEEEEDLHASLAVAQAQARRRQAPPQPQQPGSRAAGVLSPIYSGSAGGAALGAGTGAGAGRGNGAAAGGGARRVPITSPQAAALYAPSEGGAGAGAGGEGAGGAEPGAGHERHAALEERSRAIGSNLQELRSQVSRLSSRIQTFQGMTQ
jgi:hypothetical protein